MKIHIAARIGAFFFYFGHVSEFKKAIYEVIEKELIR